MPGRENKSTKKSSSKVYGKNSHNHRAEGIHKGRNFIVLIVISLLITGISYRSLNMFQYVLIGEPMAETESDGFNVDGTVHSVVSKKNHIRYTAENTRKARDVEIVLNSVVAGDTEITVVCYNGSRKGESYDVTIPEGQAYAAVYSCYEKVSAVDISSSGDLDIAGVSAAYTAPYDTEGLDSSYKTKHDNLMKCIFALFAVLLIISAVICRFGFTEKVINRSINFFNSVPSRIRSLNRRKICTVFLAAAGSACAGMILWYIAAKNILKLWNGTVDGCLFGGAAGLLLYFIILYLLRKIDRFENLFILIGITVSIMGISIMPNRLNISWDDQIHYMNTLSMSKFHIVPPSLDEYDEYMSTFTDQLKQMEKNDAASYKKVINNRYAGTTDSTMENYGVSWKNIVYLPLAVVLFLSRGIFPLSMALKITKFASAMFFFAFVYIGMRRLKYGKAALAAFSLIPTVIFIIDNFSYDYWLLALITFSAAYIIGEYQNADKILEKKDMIIMFGSFFISLIIKPVYIPLLGIAAFFPSTKFRDKKAVRRYRGFFICLVVIAVAGFAALIFGGGLGAGDARGGEVSPSGQIKYIFSDPARYAKLLLTGVKLYLYFPSVGYYVNDTAYIGPVKSRLGEALLIWLIFAVILDRRKQGKKISTGMKLSVIPLAFITICCIGTAMYVTYTPVGNGAINGFQGRYLMPVLSPVILSMATTGLFALPYNKSAERVMQGSIITVSLIFLMCVMSVFTVQ